METLEAARVVDSPPPKRPTDIRWEELEERRWWDERTMRLTFFWVFFGFFCLFSLTTFVAIVMSTFRLGLSHLNESYIKMLYGTFVAELAAFVIALGYGLFGLKRGA